MVRGRQEGTSRPHRALLTQSRGLSAFAAGAVRVASQTEEIASGEETCSPVRRHPSRRCGGIRRRNQHWGWKVPLHIDNRFTLCYNMHACESSFTIVNHDRNDDRHFPYWSINLVAIPATTSRTRTSGTSALMDRFFPYITCATG